MRRYGENKDMMIMEDIVSRLRTYMESEARSRRMDIGCVTPEYVYRLWGSKVELKKSKASMAILKSES